MADLLYKDEVYAIVGAAMEVHRVLGCGYFSAEQLQRKRMINTKRDDKTFREIRSN